MKIVIDDRRVRKLCEDSRHAQKKLGAKVARKLRVRLSDLDAAESLFDLPPAYRPHALGGERDGQFAIDIDWAHRIVMECADEPPPLDDNEALQWGAVRAVRIVFIGDYHD